MIKKNWIAFACLLFASAIAIGALAAHALENKISPKNLEVLKTGAFYQFIVAIGIVINSVLLVGNSKNKLINGLFGAAFVFFSCSLYFISLRELLNENLKKLGALAPIGGIAMILAFLIMTWQLFKSKSE